MLRITTLICLFLFSCLSQASTLYQVDMIIFMHQPTSSQLNSNVVTPPDTRHAIYLQNYISGALTPYHFLPASASHLSSEYWALNRKTNYQVLAHYTWLQPANNQRAVALSAAGRNGWNVEGTLRIRRSNYYLMDTELLFSTPDKKNKTSFLFSQKQRLKPGTTYYLDHSHAGMLIKVHQIN